MFWLSSNFSFFQFFNGGGGTNKQEERENNHNETIRTRTMKGQNDERRFNKKFIQQNVEKETIMK